eukprot:TRINITY_DN22982_c0_g1_i6.p2 TRINITY_DN22982_c0_g1~~TRINITY_DN22982_c0_g1_i6.p2  ORF type:complete len:100 (-),score=5.26 TRINITY_DN22982_c0_g1_i6:346-645(-)
MEPRPVPVARPLNEPLLRPSAPPAELFQDESDGWSQSAKCSLIIVAGFLITILLCRPLLEPIMALEKIAIIPFVRGESLALRFPVLSTCFGSMFLFLFA